MAIDKFFEAIKILRPDTEMTWVLPIETEEDFNKVQWTVGVDNGKAVSNTSCPHSEITWSAVNTKMNELQAEYDSLVYARKRKKEYPSLHEFAEAYTEKEFGEDSTKMDAYKIKYNKVRTDNPKE